MRAAIVAVALLVLALPEGARALPYLLVSRVLDPGLTVEVWADDGLTTASDGVAVDYFLGSAQAEVVGVLNPVVAIDRLELRLPEIELDFTLGSAAIPTKLTISATWVWTPGDDVPVGTTQALLHPIASFGAQGTLETFEGAVLPFQLETSDWSPDGRMLEDGGDVEVLASADGRELEWSPSAATGASVQGDAVLRPVGSSGGIDYFLSIKELGFGEALLVQVPEPGSALLLGLALTGLALVARRP